MEGFFRMGITVEDCRQDGYERLKMEVKTLER